MEGGRMEQIFITFVQALGNSLAFLFVREHVQPLFCSPNKNWILFFLAKRLIKTAETKTWVILVFFFQLCTTYKRNFTFKSKLLYKHSLTAILLKATTQTSPVNTFSAPWRNCLDILKVNKWSCNILMLLVLYVSKIFQNWQLVQKPLNYLLSKDEQSILFRNVEIHPVFFRTTHSHKRETTWCYRKPNKYLLLSACKLSNLKVLHTIWFLLNDIKTKC